MEGKSNKRKHKREIFNYKVELVTNKNKYKCASFDLSEGGIRVVTDKQIQDISVLIQIDNLKLKGKIVHTETRKASLMSGATFYYGIQFLNPIHSDIKSELVLKSRKLALR